MRKPLLLCLVLVLAALHVGANETQRLQKDDDKSPAYGKETALDYEGSGYIGCFEDDSSSSTVDGPLLTDNSMTIEQCRDKCHQLNKNIAGLENGNACYCDNTYKKTRRFKDSQCNSPCLGNMKQNCGGHGKMSVYKAKPGKHSIKNKLKRSKRSVRKSRKRGKNSKKIGRKSRKSKKSRTKSRKSGGKNKKIRTKRRKSGGKSKKIRTKSRKSGGKNKKIRIKRRKSGGKNKKIRTKRRKSGGKNKKIRTKRRKSGGKNKKIPTKRRKSGGKNKKIRTKRMKSGGKNKKIPTKRRKNTGKNKKIRTKSRKNSGRNKKVHIQYRKLSGKSGGKGRKSGGKSKKSGEKSNIRKKRTRTCRNVKCRKNFVCVKGKCKRTRKKRTCKNVKCKKNFVCVKGKCKRRKTKRTCKNVKCKKNFACVKGKCKRTKKKRTCKNVKCKKNFVCVKGKCKRKDTWKCYHYSATDKKQIKKKGDKTVCQRFGRIFTKGKNTKYPGCKTCWCCQKKGTTTCKRNCKKNAECKNGKCQCKKGFYKSRRGSCKKKKRTCKNVKCRKNFVCVKGKCKRKGRGIANIVCEGKSATLKCPGRKIIKILGATYGRTDMTTCKDPRIKTTSCSSDKPLPIIRKKCDGVNSCTVTSSNGLYGDPCTGTYKYLAVRYTCKAKKRTCKNVKCKKNFVCVKGKCKRKGTSKCKKPCHKNAKCHKGRCICKKGYSGDGVNKCSKSCTCSATGDPHYRLFDGQMIHFMGTCKYLLSKYNNNKSTCRYEVQVRNENRRKNKRVSFTKSVHVIVKGTKIDLLKKKKVQINGVKTFLPYKSADFSITNTGRYIKLVTLCKVVITWDGRSAVTVITPKHLSPSLSGLCGNCNGIRDDFRLSGGLDVRMKPDKFKLIGESYLIPEGNDKKCGIETPPDPCTPALRKKAEAQSACGRINIENPHNPFKKCASKDKEMVEDMYETCIYDYCAYSDVPDMLDTVVCEAAEGLEERCENMGLDINWRTKSFCPITCGENMEYNSAISGCPATCIDEDAPKYCIMAISEGCQCKKGFVLSDDKCIPKEQCGCRGPGGEYYPIGTEVTSRDCTTITRCIVTKSGKATLKLVQKQKCHRNGKCILQAGMFQCICEDGYKGDGINKCKGPKGPDIENTICEGKSATLKCPGRKIIKIIGATYGRTDMTTCKDPRIKTISCSSDKPLPIIRKECDGVNSCTVTSSNGLYGDPCTGTYKYLVVRYICEGNQPKCGSSVCHSDAKCQRGRCVCKKGFIGDGVNSCMGTCTCSATGDPHYRTFDGQVIHFMGICTYTMVKSTGVDKCGSFRVEVKNEHRGNKRVSFTQYVDVILEDTVIHLGRKNQILVNNVEVFMPYSCVNFEITASGRYVRLQTTCGMVVTWNGRGAVSVSLPKTYSGKVSGLCGDCNGKRDDFRTATGEDVRSKKNKFVLIGNSYMVKEKSDMTNAKCIASTIDDEPCSSKDKLEKASRNTNCGMMNPENTKSPFKSCFSKNMAMSKEIYDTCLYDYCSNTDQPELLTDVVCESMEGYEEQCENMGLSITWRKKKLCPMQCEANMEYSSSVSGCPATCVNPEAPASCRLPNSEGCQCKRGLLLSGTECVPKSKCGCRGPQGEYYPFGKRVTSADCSIITECSIENGKAMMIKVKSQKCHKNARCRLRRGQYKCVCRRKYKGNGVGSCKAVCKPKCRKNAVCVKGKCKCRRGYYRSKLLGICKRKKKTCKPKCGKNSVCVKGKCKCRRGYYRSKLLGICKRKKKTCKPKCGNNSVCVKGKCKCRRGYYRPKRLGICKRRRNVENIICEGKSATLTCHGTKTIKILGATYGRSDMTTCKDPRIKTTSCSSDKPLPIIRKECDGVNSCTVTSSNELYGDPCTGTYKYLAVRYTCKAVCKPKCRKNSVCIKGKCKCRRGYYKSKLLGICKRKKKRCKPKCGKNSVCVKGKCKPRIVCKPKCRKNAVCINGKCKCRRGYYKSKLLGICKRRKCKRKCRKNAVCRKGKCRCKSGFFQTKKGYCIKRCTAMSCGVNAFCFKRKYCRCKEGYGGDPKILCTDARECLTETLGLDYVGAISTTITGRTCQHWKKQSPHAHRFYNVGDGHNYCRNPDREAKPWCYTTDKDKRWEYCDIPLCNGPKPPCSTSLEMTCSSKSKNKTECTVPDADKINYVELVGSMNNAACVFGVTYGYYGKTIWSTKICQNKVKVCITPDIPDPEPPSSEGCRTTERGRKYKGSASVTENGLTCQYWEFQYPHKHSFANLQTEHNYCRNPDNSARPWCYTNDPSKRWEYCHIPMCAACTIQEDIVKCKASIQMSGKCLYKSKQGSKCNYSVEVMGSEATVKMGTTEITLTNGGTLSECAEFTYDEGTLLIEEDVCKCKEDTM